MPNWSRWSDLLMKWKTTKYEPAEGDIRTKRKFAFLPVTADEYTVWLETYDSVQKYTKVTVYVHRGVPDRWMRWEEIRRLPLYAYP
jgi:hypothetical protein